MTTFHFNVPLSLCNSCVWISYLDLFSKTCDMPNITIWTDCSLFLAQINLFNDRGWKILHSVLFWAQGCYKMSERRSWVGLLTAWACSCCFAQRPRVTPGSAQGASRNARGQPAAAEQIICGKNRALQSEAMWWCLSDWAGDIHQVWMRGGSELTGGWPPKWDVFAQNWKSKCLDLHELTWSLFLLQWIVIFSSERTLEQIWLNLKEQTIVEQG